jgi:hypothetical protein
MKWKEKRMAERKREVKGRGEGLKTKGSKGKEMLRKRRSKGQKIKRKGE